MVLATHQLQGSYVLFPTRCLSWSKGLRLRRHIATVRMIGNTDRCLSSKATCLSVGASHVGGVKAKSTKILAFKGSAQHDESGGRASGSKIPKNSVKLSYLPKENEETVAESSKGNDVALPYASETNQTIAGSPAIHKLFKKWLKMLLTQSPNQVVDEGLTEGPPPTEMSEESHVEIHNRGRGEFLKSVWCQFWDLDATIKLPLLIFFPWYLAVNAIYGAEVSKELTPLWVLGPLIVAVYIKLLRWLCSLYIFSFKKTAEIVKNLPTYYRVIYNYISQGKLKEDVRARFWQPVVDIKNGDYKELSKRKLKEFQEWLMERYLDFVESIWPYYCRTIRFLKRANLI